MARFVNGINGPFVGKIGGTVGSSRFGKPYLKGTPLKKKSKTRKKNRTPNRTKFAEVHYWLQPMLDFVKCGYLKYRTTSGEFNAAKSYVMQNAVEGEAPSWTINPAKVLLSQGNLPLSPDIAFAKAGTDKIEFSWATDIFIENATGSDQVMMMAYNVEKKQAYSETTGQFRKTGSDTLRVEKGQSYHIYMAFTSHDREKQSDSVYLGELQM